MSTNQDPRTAVQQPSIQDISRNVRLRSRGAALAWLADLNVDESALRAAAVDWVENAFLDCLYDVGQETYPSYYADRLLDHGPWGVDHDLIWRTIGQIAESLRALERQRISLNPPGGLVARHHHSRVSACDRIIARCSTSVEGRLFDAEIARRIELSLLPCTDLHDERMFIRVIQIFEVTFSYLHEQFKAVMVDGSRAATHLADAAEVLELYQDFLRLLTTISIEEFAQIRQATFGRSAVQSTAYREFEGLARSNMFSERIRKALRESDSGTAAELNESLVKLQQGWRAFKRSHWGIAKKVIGQKPGTGGTAGVSYLEERARHDLFNLSAIMEEGDKG